MKRLKLLVVICTICILSTNLLGQMTWTQATSAASWSTRWQHTSVVFDNKMWVMGGYGGSYLHDVWYSTDGTNWTCATSAAPWSARCRPTSVVYDKIRCG